jgi:hypothetical protein
MDYRTLTWFNDVRPKEVCVLWVSELQIIQTVQEQVFLAKGEPDQFNVPL